MRETLRRPFVRILDRMVLRVWARRLRRTYTADQKSLRKTLRRIRPLRSLLDATARVAVNRLAEPEAALQKTSLPSRTNWVWQPDLALSPDFHAADVPGNDSAVSADTRLFHDAESAEIGLRQISTADNKPGLCTEIYGFDGTYLSFAVALPKEALSGLRPTDLFRLELVLEIERPVELSARLNLRHGPNTEKIVRRFDLAKGERMVEFDVSYSDFNPERGKEIWIDIIFNHPGMNRIDIYGIHILRRGRSDI